MSDERLQILQMVAAGKVSPEEAARLLDAVENGHGTGNRPKATRVRIHFVDGKKVVNFAIGVGLARWLLSLPMVHVDFGNVRLDGERLARAIEEGATGKVMEFAEENRRMEIWLEP